MISATTAVLKAFRRAGYPNDLVALHRRWRSLISICKPLWSSQLFVDVTLIISRQCDNALAFAEWDILIWTPSGTSYLAQKQRRTHCSKQFFIFMCGEPQTLSEWSAVDICSCWTITMAFLIPLCTIRVSRSKWIIHQVMSSYYDNSDSLDDSL